MICARHGVRLLRLLLLLLRRLLLLMLRLLMLWLRLLRLKRNAQPLPI